MSWLEVGIVAICLFPIWGALLFEFWEGWWKPLRIPTSEIEAAAHDLLIKYGNRAAEIAYIQEDRAWRYSDSFEQGKWRRVRRHLMQKC